MADDMKRFGRRIQNIRGKVQQAMALAVLRGGTVIELRAKEILREKGHIRTGTLYRGITTQLGQVSKTQATALIGASPFYASNVEELPKGTRIPRHLTKSGRIVNRGEGGGYLFPAAHEKLAEAIRAAGDVLERAMAEGGRE